MTAQETRWQVINYREGIIGKISHTVARNLQLSNGTFNSETYIAECRNILAEMGLENTMVEELCHAADTQAQALYVTHIITGENVPGHGGSMITARALLEQDAILLKGFTDLMVAR